MMQRSQGMSALATMGKTLDDWFATKRELSHRAGSVHPTKIHSEADPGWTNCGRSLNGQQARVGPLEALASSRFPPASREGREQVVPSHSRRHFRNRRCGGSDLEGRSPVRTGGRFLGSGAPQ